MMGSGKSTVGKSLSEKLKNSFIDIDQEIEKREKKTINEIFKIIKSIKGYQTSLKHDSYDKRQKNSNKQFQKYEFLGDRVLGLVISEYLINNFSNTLNKKEKDHTNVMPLYRSSVGIYLSLFLSMLPSLLPFSAIC